MEKTNRFFYLIVIAFGIVTIGLGACSKDAEDPAPEENQGATASIQLGEADPFPFESSIETAAAAQSNKIALNFSDIKTNVMLAITLISTEGEIASGQTYTLIPGKLGLDGLGTAKLNPVGSSSSIESNYGTVKDINGDNEFDGSGTVKITSLTEDHIEGTFSIIMYSDAGEKAVLKDGKFNMGIDFKF